MGSNEQIQTNFIDYHYRIILEQLKTVKVWGGELKFVVKLNISFQYFRSL